MDYTNLRPIDKILIATLILLEGLLITQNKLLIGNTLLILTGITVKLYNMYRLSPREIEQRKREDGLSGLLC